jgi:large subunit ribosomal protein L10
MARPEKIAEVENLTEKMQKSEGIVLADFSGLSVKEVNELRGKCREAGVEFRVVKNRLARRAATAADMTELESILKGPSGMAFGFESPVEPAKVLMDFADGNDKITVKGGYLDGKVLSLAEVEVLSKIPGKQELLGMIVGGFQAPTRGFVGVLHGTVSALARVMNAVAEQKAESA